MAQEDGSYTVQIDVRKAGALVVMLAVAAMMVGLFLWMVGPAAAREVQAACNGMRPSWQNKAFRTLPAKAPDFKLKDSAGTEVTLSQYKGRMVLVNFWASWCDVCKAEKRSMKQLSDALGDELVILSIASDESWEAVDQSLRIALGGRTHASDQPYGGAPFHLLLDPPPEGSNLGKIAAAWGLEKVPESFLIDRDGNIVMYLVNKRDWSADVVQTCVQSYVDGT